MKEFKHHYTIYPDNNPVKFKAVRQALKSGGFGDGTFCADVDGSTMQYYETDKGDIRLLDDYDVCAVYVDSDVELNETLKSLIWHFEKKGA